MQKGFTESWQTDAIVRDYKCDGDSVLLFMEELGYEVSNEEYITIGKLYEQYQIFCERGAYFKQSKKMFTAKLRKMGINLFRKSQALVAYLKVKGDNK